MILASARLDGPTVRRDYEKSHTRPSFDLDSVVKNSFRLFRARTAHSTVVGLSALRGDETIGKKVDGEHMSQYSQSSGLSVLGHHLWGMLKASLAFCAVRSAVSSGLHPRAATRRQASMTAAHAAPAVCLSDSSKSRSAGSRARRWRASGAPRRVRSQRRLWSHACQPTEECLCRLG